MGLYGLEIGIRLDRTDSCTTLTRKITPYMHHTLHVSDSAGLSKTVSEARRNLNATEMRQQTCLETLQ